MTTAPGSTAPTTCVEYDVRGRVAEIVLNRPEASNAIDVAMARSLAEAFVRAGSDPAVDVVLLRGRGRRFCGGGDLAAMAGAPDREAAVAELAADIVVAGESAKLVTAYTSVGLTPDGGMSWLLPRVVGQRRAVETILTGEPISASRAADFGIVSETCADEDVLARARERANALAARPAAARSEARRLVRASWDQGLDEHLDDEAATIAAAAGTEETGGLIAGFVGGR
ncbi:enoyl-CoA hydratase/isomerase family protein [Nocardioides immobilis]|uniref:enoyl-CoA hydratase/isomerase family protein n=1 Tax=Nocardioides immobilis TaxID=2049295 RepID=UPI001C7127B1|nr:enoyl-CoA hydratase/isomerase family protein [Nocardioides immobilis]